MTDTYTALNGPEQMTDIPEWALERACAAVGVSLHDYKIRGFVRQLRNAIDIVAEHIAEHEEPPVDPLLIEAREIVKSYYPKTASDYTSRRAAIAIAVAALRRGIELGKEGAALKDTPHD